MKPIINGKGEYFTRDGGAIMPAVAIEAMAGAATQSVNMYELQEAAGQRIAELTRNEAAFVSNGTTGGVLLSIATCIAGTDPALADRLPQTRGMRNQVLVSCGGTEADNGIKGAGGRIVPVGAPKGATPDDFLKAMNDRTAAILLVEPCRRSIDRSSLGELIGMAHGRNVPVLVDGAYAIPPKENFWRYTEEGVDGFITSGGKAICGPQASGLVLGKAWLIEGCRYHSSPNLQIGRPNKVGKEQFAGLFAALQYFLSTDLHPPEDQAKLQYMSEVLGSHPAIASTEIDGPTLTVTLDSNAVSLSGRAVARELINRDRRILIRGRDDGLIIRARFLRDGEERIVVEEVAAVIENAGAR